MHTSTITVVVLQEPTEIEVKLEESDLSWSFFRGSGNGGQKKNKTSSAVRLVHEPSGMAIRVESERSQSMNKEVALAMLRARLYAEKSEKVYNARESSRRKQAGSGMRADKIRTVQYQNGQVTDHESGWRISLKKYLRGSW